MQQILDEETVRNIVNYTIEAYHKEHAKTTKEKKDRMKYNIKELFLNYRKVKQGLQNRVLQATDLTKDDLRDYSFEDFQHLMEGSFKNDELKVLSIKENVAINVTLLANFDRMLKVFKNEMLNSSKQEDARCWRVIFNKYLGDMIYSTDEIAKMEYIDTATVWRDCQRAYNELAILMFGYFEIFDYM